MNLRRWQGIALAALFVAVVVSGCQKSKKESDTKTDKKAWNTSAKDADNKKPHDHSEWWWDEHGIPEKECSKCQDDVAQAVASPFAPRFIGEVSPQPCEGIFGVTWCPI